jgi:hypothetical protein
LTCRGTLGAVPTHAVSRRPPPILSRRPVIKKAGLTRKRARTGAVTPAKRGKGAKAAGLEEEQEKTPAQRRAAMTWSQRLKREPSRFRSTVRLLDSTVGHDGDSMIIQECRKPVAMSHPFQLGLAKTIHLSGKAATSAMGRTDLHTQSGEEQDPAIM